MALPPGATRISFYAAAPEPVAVTFGAGVGRDQFQVPEVTHTLTPTWQPYSISLAGARYGTNVFGAFSWTLKDTSKPARFFIDGVVWEGSGGPPSYPQPPRPSLPPPMLPAAENPAPPSVPGGQRNGAREFLFDNRCAETVWVAASATRSRRGRLPPRRRPAPDRAGPGRALDRALLGPHRLPLRRRRRGSPARAATCGSVERCPGSTGKPPVTLAEFTLGDGAGNDTYDVSLVDGFNLPMAIVPMPGTFTRGARQDEYDCGAPTCAKDFNAICPAQMRVQQFRRQGRGLHERLHRLRDRRLLLPGRLRHRDHLPRHRLRPLLQGRLPERLLLRLRRLRPAPSSARARTTPSSSAREGAGFPDAVRSGL